MIYEDYNPVLHSPCFHYLITHCKDLDDSMQGGERIPEKGMLLQFDEIRTLMYIMLVRRKNGIGAVEMKDIYMGINIQYHSLPWVHRGSDYYFGFDVSTNGMLDTGKLIQRIMQRITTHGHDYEKLKCIDFYKELYKKRDLCVCCKFYKNGKINILLKEKYHLLAYMMKSFENYDQVVTIANEHDISLYELFNYVYDVRLCGAMPLENVDPLLIPFFQCIYIVSSAPALSTESNGYANRDIRFMEPELLPEDDVLFQKLFDYLICEQFQFHKEWRLEFEQSLNKDATGNFIFAFGAGDKTGKRGNSTMRWLESMYKDLLSTATTLPEDFSAYEAIKKIADAAGTRIFFHKDDAKENLKKLKKGPSLSVSVDFFGTESTSFEDNTIGKSFSFSDTVSKSNSEPLQMLSDSTTLFPSADSENSIVTGTFTNDDTAVPNNMGQGDCDTASNSTINTHEETKSDAQMTKGCNPEVSQNESEKLLLQTENELITNEDTSLASSISQDDMNFLEEIYNEYNELHNIESGEQHNYDDNMNEHLELEAHEHPKNYIYNSESNNENCSGEGFIMSVEQSVKQGVKQSVKQGVKQSVEHVGNDVLSAISENSNKLRSTQSFNTALNTYEAVDNSTENDEPYLLDTNSHFIKEDCLDDTDSTEQQDLESYQRQNFDSYIQGLNNHIPIYLSRVIYYSPAELLASYPLDLTVTCEEVISHKKSTTKTFKTTENTAFLLETSESTRHSCDTVATQLRHSCDTPFKTDIRHNTHVEHLKSVIESGTPTSVPRGSCISFTDSYYANYDFTKLTDMLPNTTINSSILKKCSCSLSHEEDFKLLETAIIKDHCFCIEATYDENGKEVLVFFTNSTAISGNGNGRSKWYRLYMQDSRMLSIIAPYISHKSYTKVCYSSHLLYAFLKKYGLSFRSIFSISSCIGVLASAYQSIPYRTIYTRVFNKHIFDRSSIPDLLSIMRKNIAMYRSLTCLLSISNKQDVWNRQQLFDIALGCSYIPSNVFPIKPCTLFRCVDYNTYYMFSYHGQNSLMEGRFIRFSLKKQYVNSNEDYALVPIMLQSLANKGYFRKYHLYVTEYSSYTGTIFIEEKGFEKVHSFIVGELTNRIKNMFPRRIKQATLLEIFTAKANFKD